MFTLNDADTGAPLAHMSANLLSAYRTGAIPGVGAKYLARQNSRVIGLLGPGVMGKTTIAAFLSVCPNVDTVKVKGRGAASLDAFIAWLKNTYPQVTTIQIVDTLEEVVRDSDLVAYCSSGETGDASTYPIVKREWVKAGAFLAMPALCALDEGMERADVRKVLDNTGLYNAWFEEVPKPAHNTIPIIGVRFMDMLADGALTADQLEDIGQIIAGEAPGRKNDDEIIIMSVGGMPVEDVAWGTVLYRNALQRNIGVKLNLWETPELA